ncbi:sigma factor [Streptomyces sp. NPDC056723]|uniref:sigma factor n=1 Tax=Streptomyces sp. NPDC056723 TaxID=3345925 RepID=UPI0036CB28F1
MPIATADEFESHRPRMVGLAYRMLGSAEEAEEAEDTVQDAYPRWSGTDRGAIGRPAAWLAKVVTNLCPDRLTSARAQRERYAGPWLPEPVLTSDGTLGPKGMRDGGHLTPERAVGKGTFEEFLARRFPAS